MFKCRVRRALRSTSCNSMISAFSRDRNSTTPGSFRPRLIFQLTTVTELGGQSTQRGLAKLPVSISCIEVTVCYTLQIAERIITQRMKQQSGPLSELEHASLDRKKTPTVSLTRAQGSKAGVFSNALAGRCILTRSILVVRFWRSQCPKSVLQQK